MEAARARHAPEAERAAVKIVDGHVVLVPRAAAEHAPRAAHARLIDLDPVAVDMQVGALVCGRAGGKAAGAVARVRIARGGRGVRAPGCAGVARLWPTPSGAARTVGLCVPEHRLVPRLEAGGAALARVHAPQVVRVLADGDREGARDGVGARALREDVVLEAQRDFGRVEHALTAALVQRVRRAVGPVCQPRVEIRRDADVRVGRAEQPDLGAVQAAEVAPRVQVRHGPAAEAAAAGARAARLAKRARRRPGGRLGPALAAGLRGDRVVARRVEAQRERPPVVGPVLPRAQVGVKGGRGEDGRPPPPARSPVGRTLGAVTAAGRRWAAGHVEAAPRLRRRAGEAASGRDHGLRVRMESAAFQEPQAILNVHEAHHARQRTARAAGARARVAPLGRAALAARAGRARLGARPRGRRARRQGGARAAELQLPLAVLPRPADAERLPARAGGEDGRGVAGRRVGDRVLQGPGPRAHRPPRRPPQGERAPAGRARGGRGRRAPQRCDARQAHRADGAGRAAARAAGGLARAQRLAPRRAPRRRARARRRAGAGAGARAGGGQHGG